MKSSDLLSIKDFSKFTGIKQSTLRYYDDIGLFTPAKRGEDNDYRYYLPSQIIDIKMISVLTDIGVSLKKIAKMQDERTPSKIADLLLYRQLELDKEMHELQRAYSISHIFLQCIKKGISLDNEAEITVQHTPASGISLGGKNNFRGSEIFYDALIDFYENGSKRNIDLNYPIGGWFEHMPSFLDKPSKPDRFFSANPLGNDIRPEGDYMFAYTRGYYGEPNDIAERMWDYAQKNYLEFSGPVYNLFLLDEISITDRSQYLLQASVRVTKV